MELTNLKEKVKEAKEVLVEINGITTSLKAAEEDFEKTVKEQREKLSSLKAKFDFLNTEISEFGIKFFKETNSKDLLGGYKIQERKKIKYDEESALEWCKEKQMFITFDKKAFEKAVEGLKLDFVKIEKEPSLAVPKEIVVD